MTHLNQSVKYKETFSLSPDMIEIITNSSRKLEDEHINKYLELLERNTEYEMQTPLLYQVIDEITKIRQEKKYIQILFSHIRTNDLDGPVINYSNPMDGHWICSYYENGTIYIYDSLNRKSLNTTESVYLKKLFPFNPKIIFCEVQQQPNSVDCGVYAIAFAVSLSFGKDPRKIAYDHTKLRSHLYEMLVNNTYTHFPISSDNVNRATFEESIPNRRKRLQIVSNYICKKNRTQERPVLDSQSPAVSKDQGSELCKSNTEQQGVDLTGQNTVLEYPCTLTESARLKSTLHDGGQTDDRTNKIVKNLSIKSIDDRILCGFSRITDPVFSSKNNMHNDNIYTDPSLKKNTRQCNSKRKTSNAMEQIGSPKKNYVEISSTTAQQTNSSLTTITRPNRKRSNSMKMTGTLLKNNVGDDNITDNSSSSLDSTISKKRKRKRAKKLQNIKRLKCSKISQLPSNDNIDTNESTCATVTSLKSNTSNKRKRTGTKKIQQTILHDKTTYIDSGSEKLIQEHNEELKSERNILNSENDLNNISSDIETHDSSESEYSENDQNLKRVRKKSNKTLFLHGIHDIDSVDETTIKQHYSGKMNVLCRSCKSFNFKEEEPYDRLFTKCCHKGKVKLPEIVSYPDLLKDLLAGKSKDSKHFKENIRSYNNALAFASTGAKLDKPLGRGPFVFRIHGQIYHNTFAMHPNENEERKYGQLYVIDSQQANHQRLSKDCNVKCNAKLMHDLDQLLRAINPFAKAFNMMSELEKIEQEKAKLENRTLKPIRMWITRNSNLDKNRFNEPTCNEVAIIFTGEDGEPPIDRDLCIHPKDNNSIPISSLSPNLDPMTYPILFPRGEKGWTIGLKHCFGKRDITPLQYYSYRLATRKPFNPCLSAGKLTQQFIVDIWCKIEGERLKYIKQNQRELRSELYSGLMDYLQKKANDDQTITPGRMVILPSSFQTSPRAYQQLYMDAMCLVQRYGKPQLFITMTCNPNWPEIRENLRDNESPSDRPDLIARVFQMKLNHLKKLLFDSQIFGKHIAYIYVIEFQKRGLPHVHLLLFLEKDYIIRNADAVDKIISAEIPNVQKNPRLYELVKQFMVHGPCGTENDHSPCMDPKTKKCTKNFPKQLSAQTKFSHDSYPIYRRRNNGRVICYKGKNSIRLADNRFIVPYNAFLLLSLNCHCNVEVCSTVQWIKYLFKYCYKGHDCAFVEIYDEIIHYLSTRYVCPPEAMFRILEFKMHKQSHATIRLAVHLERQEIIYFHEGSEEQAIEKHKNTTLTAWFELNKRDEDARKFLYTEIPDHYVFNQSDKIWKKRSKKNKPIISRMYFVSPKEIERYNLRLLLLYVRGAKNFKELRSFEGVTYETFTEAAVKRGLIENDEEIEKCLDEAISFKFPRELCRLLAYIFVFCFPQNGKELWTKYKEFFMDPKIKSIVSEQIALQNIQEVLKSHGYSLIDFGLPNVNEALLEADSNNADVDLQQQNIEILKKEVIILKKSLNHEQLQVYHTVTKAVEHPSVVNRYFYLDGPGGSGKSYLLNTIIKAMECENRCVLAVAWTGIAANLLRRGRTVHSTFQLPMQINETTTCNISKTSKHGHLIKTAELIIWDEVTMSPKYSLQAVDLLLRDLTENNIPFGGKVVLLSGDWRQILPVVKHGTRTQILEVCIKNSYLWKHFKPLALTINERIDDSQKEFKNWLLEVGNGSSPLQHENDMLEMPSELLTQNYITGEIYGESINKDDEKVYNYAILSPINSDVFDINNEIVKKLEGEAKQYLSIDTNESDANEICNFVPVEYMNSITPSGFPPHNLVLKIGTIVILLRNLNINHGLCNGTRLVISHLLNNLIVAQIITGGCKGQTVLLPKIKLISSGDDLPFKMVRKQFPIRIAYAMTINKAQGQTFDRVGIYLKHDVFSHGQLYVALSRVQKKENLRVSIVDTDKLQTCTKNVVFKEIFEW